MKRVFIFAHYDKENTLQPYILNNLHLLSELGEILLISDSPYLDNLPLDIRFHVTQIYRHDLYDAYSYYCGFNTLKKEDYLKKINYLYFVNSSIIFPKSSKLEFIDCIHTMERSEADIWGMCKSHYLLQSYWIGCKKDVFPHLDNFWKEYKHCTFENIAKWFPEALQNSWTEKRYERRKNEVGEELAKKWIYTVTHFEEDFSKYMTFKGCILKGADEGGWPNSRFITKAPR